MGDSTHTPLCISDLNASLINVLPDNHTYIVVHYEDLELEQFTGAPQQAFLSKLLINVNTIEEANDWLKKFSEKTKTTYRVLRGSKVSGVKMIFKTERMCQHKRKFATKSKKRMKDLL